MISCTYRRYLPTRVYYYRQNNSYRTEEKYSRSWYVGRDRPASLCIVSRGLGRVTRQPITRQVVCASVCVFRWFAVFEKSQNYRHTYTYMYLCFPTAERFDIIKIQRYCVRSLFVFITVFELNILNPAASSRDARVNADKYHVLVRRPCRGRGPLADTQKSLETKHMDFVPGNVKVQTRARRGQVSVPYKENK